MVQYLCQQLSQGRTRVHFHPSDTDFVVLQCNFFFSFYNFFKCLEMMENQK